MDDSQSSSAAAPSRTIQFRGGKVLEGLTRAGEGDAPPQKKFFRSRAHINPLGRSATDSFECPASPESVDWGTHFPAYADPTDPSGRRLCPGRVVDVADIGCGFGGLLTGLSPLLPDSLMVGMEIRPKVSEYVRLRILAARKQTTPELLNASVVNTNLMKTVLRFFAKGQMSKLFFCFPDPHFKRANHRRRIVSFPLLADYAFILRPGGLLYHITDVLDLHNWMTAHCAAHPMFERLTDAEVTSDPCVEVMRTYTEEGKKVERMQKPKYFAVFRRISDEDADARAASFDLWAGHPIDYTWIPDKAQQAHMDATEAKKRKRESEHTVPRTESGVAIVAGSIVAADSEPAADIDEAGTSSEDQND